MLLIMLINEKTLIQIVWDYLLVFNFVNAYFNHLLIVKIITFHCENKKLHIVYEPHKRGTVFLKPK